MFQHTVANSYTWFFRWFYCWKVKLRVSNWVHDSCWDEFRCIDPIYRKKAWPANCIKKTYRRSMTIKSLFPWLTHCHNISCMVGFIWFNVQFVQIPGTKQVAVNGQNSSTDHHLMLKLAQKLINTCNFLRKYISRVGKTDKAEQWSVLPKDTWTYQWDTLNRWPK